MPASRSLSCTGRCGLGINGHVISSVPTPVGIAFLPCLCAGACPDEGRGGGALNSTGSTAAFFAPFVSFAVPFHFHQSISGILCALRVLCGTLSLPPKHQRHSLRPSRSLRYPFTSTRASAAFFAPFVSFAVPFHFHQSISGILCALRVLCGMFPHFHHVINGRVISSPNLRASFSLKGPCIFR